MTEQYNDLIAFHGHSCPGLAIGYRMSTAALRFLSKSKAEDEELVAIVENDACGVDALQCLTGCTFGKGNLIFKNYGKHVFTLYHRQTGKGVRVALNSNNVPEDVRKDRDLFLKWLLEAPEDMVVSVNDVEVDKPEKAKIMASVECKFCGEGAMETRTKILEGKVACIPCWEKMEDHSQ